ncbi:MAG: phosphate acetyltransferase [Clostridiales bacterium]|nr:phosphate acetyltransferase [Clostridiales bacterium]
MSKLITKIQNRLKENKIKKTIILPEAGDERVLKAALRVLEDGIVNIILVGNNEKILEDLNNKNINEKDLDIQKYIEDESLKIYDVEKEETLYNELSTYLYDLRKHKGLTLEEAEKLAKDEVYFGILMLKKELADGLVSGAIHSTKDTLKPTLQIIGVDKNKSNIVSSFFIMEMPENRDNTKNILKYDEYIFSDAGLIENPTEDQLVDIAKASRNSYENIMGKTSYTAMLSYSTMGSASSALVEKVQNATRKLKEENIPNVDGELQLDAAIMEDIAKSKAKGSTVAGKANTLIFPDLNAGNIGYKLVQRFANANAYGPLCQGLNIPVNDLSRGSTVDDIYGVIYITAVQSN